MKESEIRLLQPSYKNMVDVFRKQTLSKDLMREIFMKLKRIDRKCIESELLFASLNNDHPNKQLLENCITYIECGLVVFIKEEIQKYNILNILKRKKENEH